MSESTRLRYISSKDPASLVEFVQALSFKLEIKGSAQYANGHWFLWVIVPIGKELGFPGVELH